MNSSNALTWNFPAWNGSTGRLLRVAALAVLASTCLASNARCFEWSDLNPFGDKKYEMKVDPDVPADHLYNEGLIRIEKKDYEAAAKRFGELQKQYPFSQWARKSLMMEVYADYLNGSYTDTTSAADRYATLYPSAPDVAYANYLAGMSLLGAMPDVHRDQDRTAKAVKYFQTILDKYPKSEYASDARFRLQVARDQLAGYEMNVGRYYLQRHDYIAAIARFREVLFKYQSTREAEEALERLTESYLALGVVNEAETAAAVLGHNYPDSEWYKEAVSRLKSDGLAPSEHQDSWISKTFRKVGLT
jgi:outer membrane protein assembly factor BamD